MAEAETAREGERIAEIQTRLVDIEAHNAPARAARILKRLGFDEAAQDGRFRNFPAAGACGWRLRRCCSPSPTSCCWMSRPTISTSKACCGSRYLQTCGTILIVSHDRDLLDDAAEHILHLERGKLTL